MKRTYYLGKGPSTEEKNSSKKEGKGPSNEEKDSVTGEKWNRRAPRKRPNTEKKGQALRKRIQQ